MRTHHRHPKWHFQNHKKWEDHSNWFFTSACSDRRATSAVEFALVVPIFLVLVFGIIIYGAYFAMLNGVHQLAAEAARSSIAGLSNAERASLAQSYVSSNIQYYPMMDPSRVSVAASPSATNANTFIVTVTYDASSSIIFLLPKLLPMPPQSVVSSAAIPYGGY